MREKDIWATWLLLDLNVGQTVFCLLLRLRQRFNKIFRLKWRILHIFAQFFKYTFIYRNHIHSKCVLWSFRARQLKVLEQFEAKVYISRFLTSQWMCKSVGLKFLLLFATHLFIVNIYFFKTFPNRIILNRAIFTVRHWHELQYKRHGQYIWEINKWINVILGFIKSVSCKYIYLPLKLLWIGKKINLTFHYKFS